MYPRVSVATLICSVSLWPALLVLGLSLIHRPVSDDLNIDLALADLTPMHLPSAKNWPNSIRIYLCPDSSQHSLSAVVKPLES